MEKEKTSDYLEREEAQFTSLTPKKRGYDFMSSGTLCKTIVGEKRLSANGFILFLLQQVTHTYTKP